MSNCWVSGSVRSGQWVGQVAGSSRWVTGSLGRVAGSLGQWVGRWVTGSVGCSIGLMRSGYWVESVGSGVGSQSRFGRGVVSGCTENQVRSRRLGVGSQGSSWVGRWVAGSVRSGSLGRWVGGSGYPFNSSRISRGSISLFSSWACKSHEGRCRIGSLGLSGKRSGLSG
jgi:hypothetical protein